MVTNVNAIKRSVVPSEKEFSEKEAAEAAKITAIVDPIDTLRRKLKLQPKDSVPEGDKISTIGIASASSAREMAGDEVVKNVAASGGDVPLYDPSQITTGTFDKEGQDLARDKTLDLQAKTMAEQDKKLISPEGIPLWGKDQTKETIKKAYKDVEEADTFHGETKEYRTSDSDAEILTNLAEDFDSAIGNPTHELFGETVVQQSGVSLAQAIEDSFGINESNKGAVGGAQTLVLSRIFSRNATMTYAQQVLDASDREHLMDDEFLELDMFNPQESLDKEQSELPQAMERGREELKKTFMRLQQEPVVRYMLYDIVSQMRRLLNPSDLEGRDVSPSDLAGAAAMLRYWTDKGYLSWSRDKQGRLLSLNTDINPLIKIDRSKLGKTKEDKLREQRDPKSEQKYRVRKPTALDKLNQIYFADMRSINNYIVPNSQLVPPVNSKLASKAMQIEISKRGKLTYNKGQLSASTIVDSENTAIKTQNAAINALAYQYKEINDGGNEEGYYSHPLANNVGELGEEPFNKYWANRSETPGDEMGYELAKQEVTDKFERLLRNLDSKILPRARDGLNRFMKYYMSPSTNRIFGMSADTNFYNDKGDIRTTLAFGNVKPVKLDGSFFDSNKILSLARANLTSDKTGENFGYDIDRKLQALEESEMQTLDFYYALANVMLSLDKSQNLKEKDLIRRDPVRLKEWLFKKPSPSSVAPIVLANKLGGDIQALFDKPTHDSKKNSIVEQNVNELPDWETLSTQYPDVAEILSSGKGEWQYPLTVLSELGRLNLERDTLPDKEKGNFNFRFNYTFEQDARQSNAAIISLVIGDPSIGDLLGLYQSDDNHPAEFLDLRDKILSGINEHIEGTFNSKADSEGLRQHYIEFFDKLKDPNGPYKGMDAGKLYARSIIVAGLYGKAPRMMFTEAAEFLSKVPALEQDLLAATQLRYTDQSLTEDDLRALMYRDMASLFHTSAQSCMGELLGYQKYMRSFGRLMGTLRGPNTIPGFLPNEEINLTSDNWSSTYNMVGENGLNEALYNETGGVFNTNIKKNSDSYIKRMNKLNQKRVKAGKQPLPVMDRAYDNAGRAVYGTPEVLVGGIVNRPDAGGSAKWAALKDRENAASDQANKDFVKNYEGILGTNFRNALPVDLIQAGDSALLMLARRIATGANPDRPLNLFSIHDAAITTAGSTLKFKNAYDNIAMSMVANSGRNMITNSWNIMDNRIGEVREEIESLPGGPNDKVVDIGTEKITTEKGVVKNWSSISNYFDEIYNYTYNNEDMFNKYEQERGMKDGKPKEGANKEYMEFLKARGKRILAVAKDNGYEMPSDFEFASQRRRARNKVTKKQFYNLLQLIEENEGVFNPEKFKTKGVKRKPLIGIIMSNKKDDSGNLIPFEHNQWTHASSLLTKIIDKVYGNRGAAIKDNKHLLDINGNQIIEDNRSVLKKGSRAELMEKVYNQSKWNNNLQYS